MFSGLIRQTGTVTFKTNGQIGIAIPSGKHRLGDSIAIDGVCLTVIKITSCSGRTVLNFDLSPETLKKTTFSKLPIGHLVNIERALTLQDALGGHIVQGHVDGVGRVTRIITKKDNREIWVQAPKPLRRALVSKGSITVNGVSLTMAQVTSDQFSVALIPYTLAHTNLRFLNVNDTVNLEADIIGKYVAAYLKRK